ncbi:hypothetical protein NNJEOMEG_01574 [Fundidesulfovibrio magnetotacticus]|uniref:DUF1634 domain-containing protein n=1 Tax=Fundidesulfovibrio magnetotacticus TaxID=2730080 RepID=A0A6V8LRY5_9BACT|nr:DUF1634 domain-containing protein [Fundidesulfovibrio magnetotacticus]GFK93740.1 hypothetical protein NNJEOMEG_01574 [Fundidesulfovibrio magnetotacticus]
MADQKNACVPVETPKEQLLYADILFWGCWGGLALMAVTYFIYLSGIMAPHVPMDKITVLWSKPVATYLSEGQVPSGWGWVVLMGKGDFLNFAGIVLLAGLTVVAYIPLIPAFLKKKEPLFAVLALLEVLVLSLAASGIVGSGGH